MDDTLHEQGIVSVFVVIFTGLLLTVAMIGFVRIMLSDQHQASVDDLSKSALDSANVGVEDAKRLILFWKSCRNGEITVAGKCAQVIDAFDSNSMDDCNTLSNLGISARLNGETLVQQKSGDIKLDQAYTCVTINTQLKDYKAQLSEGKSTVVPIRLSGGASEITLEWFSVEDLPRRDYRVITTPTTAPQIPLMEAWNIIGTNTPPMMRVQAISTGESVNFDALNNSPGTAFLYPSTGGGQASVAMTEPRRTPAIDPPKRVACVMMLNEGYACKTVLTGIPGPIAYIHLTALYTGASFRLSSASGAVEFSSPQIEIDSTGRANNYFRRIATRVEVTNTDMPYPTAAIDIGGNLCKNFIVEMNTPTGDKHNRRLTPFCTP